MRVPPAFLRRVPADAVLAACLLIAAQIELVVAGPVPHYRLAVVTALGLSVPFLWRHRYPLLVIAVVLGSFLTQTALGVPDNAQVLVPLVWTLAAFGVAAYAPLRTALAGLLVVAVPIGVLSAVGTVIPTASDLLYAITIFTMIPWVAGRLYRARLDQVHEYARRAARAEAESERRTQDVLDAERRRIARELHDIIAHSLSLMVLQAGAAGEVLHRSPERARDALETVQDTGRQALVEMKRLLAVLRSADTADTLVPQPGLAEIPALVERVRDSGLDVSLVLSDGDLHAPAGVELSVYRVVQEALTNIVKHADAGHASVRLRGGPRHIEVEIADDGRGGTPISGNGHGLLGMRERVAVYGGEFSAGATDGGFAVRARFPLDANGGRPR